MTTISTILPTSSTSSTGLIKKRRKNLLSNSTSMQNDGSSREASAESNDETELSSDLEEELDQVDQVVEGIDNNNNLNEFSNIKHHIKKNSTNNNTLLKEVVGGGIGVIDNESEGNDGDISSTATPINKSNSSLKHHHIIVGSTRGGVGEEEDETIESNGLITTSTSTSNTNTTSPNSNPILINTIPSSNVNVNSGLLSSISSTGGGIGNTRNYDESTPPSPHQSPRAVAASRYPGHGSEEAPPAWQSAPTGFLANLTAEDIQDHIKTAIAGGDNTGRAYKIMAPPQGRPVRIYADGVYDLLHYGHMLQLRQCKLAFPSVHLMVGVCSSSLVRKYKAPPVLTSEERYESVRHCKWVDEVIENAPWCVDEVFLREHKIDYVAHDEEPYISAGSEDVYAYSKSIGAFLPTKRTNGVSTSEILQRIVEGYREGEFDGKFIKLDRPDLCSTRAPSEAGTSKSRDRDGLESSTLLLPPPVTENVVEEEEEEEANRVEVKDNKVKEEELKLRELKLKKKEEEMEDLLKKLEVNA